MGSNPAERAILPSTLTSDSDPAASARSYRADAQPPGGLIPQLSWTTASNDSAVLSKSDKLV